MQGQGPAYDPRLYGPPTQPRVRRTELSGLNAVLFVILVVVAFVAAAYLLANFIRLGAAPSTVPPSTAIASASPSSSPRETPTATPEPRSSEPISPQPSATGLSLPGDVIDLISEGNVIGTVTVNELRWPDRVKGNDPPRGSRWLTVNVTYDASEGDIDYSTSDWTLIDMDGSPIQPSTIQKIPELGAGTLPSGRKKEEALVTFLVPEDTEVVLHFANGETEAEYKVKPK
jgi:hypothetical protein